jgi:aryl-alcohol dehydrogenase
LTLEGIVGVGEEVAGMKIRAAVMRRVGGPFELEDLQLDAPRADEVLVRIVATGLCHTDIYIAEGLYPPAPPSVLGHEGAGVVEQVGAEVEGLAPGDHVVLSFDSCGHCPACQSLHPVFCEHYFPLNISGCRTDGTHTLQSAAGPVAGCFLGQSSFASHVLAHPRNTIKVRKDAPLDMLGPMGCAIQTGVGSVLNVLQPTAGTSFAVFGCGAVGLAALMAAKYVGCDPIVAVDKVGSRLELAKALGASHLVDVSTADPVETIGALGGAQYVIEASGVTAAFEAAVKVLRYGGVMGMLGGHRPEATVTLNMQDSFFGKTITGIVEGNADPKTFIPYLVDLFMSGDLPIDRLVRFYALDDINQAVADSLAGRTIKPILRAGAPTSSIRAG